MNQRDIAIQINADFERLLSDKAETLNVGTSENSGDGDTIARALGKIHRNLLLAESILQQLRAAQSPESESDL